MKPRTYLPVALLMGLASAVGVQAQAASPAACTSPAPLPAELSGWTKRTPLKAASGVVGLETTTLALGSAVDATLLPTPDVRYPVRPEKPGGSVSYGGMFAFTVAAPGTYRVALDSGAWLDVLADGKPVTSTAHGHGPDCSGVRKMVDFPLKAGPHVLQIAANGKPELVVLVTRLP